MNFDGATGWLVGEVNKGLAAMFTMMNYERLGVGIQGLATGERSYQSAIEYARERIQSRAPTGPVAKDKAADPIIVHPDVRRMLLEQHAAHVGVHDDRVGGLVPGHRTGRRAALQALAGVGDGALVGHLGAADALDADGQALVVHHGEHRRQALVDFADQPATGAVEVHHAGGRGLDPHLVTCLVCPGPAAAGPGAGLGPALAGGPGLGRSARSACRSPPADRRGLGCW